MKTLQTLILCLCVNALAIAPCLARAGGAGGSSGHSSSSHSSSSHSSSSRSSSSHSSSSHSSTNFSSGSSHSSATIFPPSSTGAVNKSTESGTSATSSSSSGGFPVTTVVLLFAAGAIVVYFVYRRRKRSSGGDVSDFRAPDIDRKLGTFKQSNPDFNEAEFYKKAEKAFIDIQQSWAAKDLGKARRFVSDGVYQRFATQILMMERLKQRDEISDVKVLKTFIADIEVDGAYDILHVGITAGMKDKFISETDSSLNSPGGYEKFTEYWSFIRKRGIVKKDIYASANCPQCSGALPDNMGDSGKCPYCGTIVNSPDYDWVLSEITQSDDFALSGFEYTKADDFDERVAQLAAKNDDFSVQLLEDKASNGYLQIMTASALNEPERMRRFVSDAAFKKITGSFPQQQIVYNRVYLNDVELLAAVQRDNKNILYVGVKCSYQRARLDGNKATLIDDSLYYTIDILVMERECGKSASKGSLYAHICPSCGAPVSDSLDVKCAYCGVLLNSAKNEWIITDKIEAEDDDVVAVLESLGITNIA